MTARGDRPRRRGVVGPRLPYRFRVVPACSREDAATCNTTCRLVVSVAAMPRSGSTWLYNFARLLIHATRPPPVVAGFGTIGAWQGMLASTARSIVVKTHDFIPDLASRTSIAFVTHRDLRAICASAAQVADASLRNRGLDGGSCYRGLHRFIGAHGEWRKWGAFDFRFEQHFEGGFEARHRLAEQVALLLGVKHCQRTRSRGAAKRAIESTLSATDRLFAIHAGSSGGRNRSDFHLDQIHAKHITGAGANYSRIIPPRAIQEIEESFGDWLSDMGYPLAKTQSRTHGFQILIQTNERATVPTSAPLRLRWKRKSSSYFS